jgi:hypothetical protein
MEQRFCKKCLLKDVSKDEYFKNIYEYIENLDEDIKAEEKLYEQRLSACKECDNLVNGLCRICGCFVEMRAAVKKNYCPDLSKKW